MEEADRARLRRSDGRHGDKIGKWVVVDGVRDHYRGVLLGVTDLGYGRALLHLHPVFWLQSLEGTNGEREVRTTDAHPFDLSSDVVGGLSVQPVGW